MQPERLSEPAAMSQLRAWSPDLIVVAAFGQLLRPEVLDLPTQGCLNIHASLLPRWRGAAPINAAILAGDRETGITLMQMDPGLDTGPIIKQRVLPIQENDTAGSLFSKLAQLSADFLIESLPAYLRGELPPQQQDDSLSSYAPMLKKSDGELNFNQSAIVLARQVRAYNPWPGSYIISGGKRLKIHSARAISVTSAGIGVFSRHDGHPAIGTSEGLLILEQVQPAGKKAMPGETFLRGARDWDS
jgi:methionyl-tRNA formyltransferase